MFLNPTFPFSHSSGQFISWPGSMPFIMDGAAEAETTAVLTKNRIGLRGFQGNQIHTVAIWSLEVPNPNFQPIIMMSKFYSMET